MIRGNECASHYFEVGNMTYNAFENIFNGGEIMYCVLKKTRFGVVRCFNGSHTSATHILQYQKSTRHHMHG